MIKHTIFLKWWLFICIVLIASIFGYREGIFLEVYKADFTKLSVVLVALFTYMSVWCGVKTWQLSQFLDTYDPEKENNSVVVERIEHLTEVGWFVSDLCLSIGMIGTVVGFITMLGGFFSIDFSDTSTLQNLIKELGSGMSVALYTTLTGLTCSALLKIQYFNLNQAISRILAKIS
tara:strand:- start:6463 stop:6990 length:528 start_codon:yes stop_codon:yes gene_type:complete